MEDTHPQDGIPVALYVRASGNSEDSITVELDVLKEFAGKNGMEPAVEYIDRNQSRAAFDRMMEDGTGQNSSFQRVVVLNLRSFPRSMEERIECTKRLEANGIRVQVMPITNLSHAQRSFIEKLQAAVDEYLQESEDTNLPS